MTPASVPSTPVTTPRATPCRESGDAILLKAACAKIESLSRQLELMQLKSNERPPNDPAPPEPESAPAASAATGEALETAGDGKTDAAEEGVTEDDTIVTPDGTKVS